MFNSNCLSFLFYFFTEDNASRYCFHLSENNGLLSESLLEINIAPLMYVVSLHSWDRSIASTLGELTFTFSSGEKKVVFHIPTHLCHMSQGYHILGIECKSENRNGVGLTHSTVSLLLPS